MEEIDLDSPFVDFHCDSPVYVDGFLFYIAIDKDSLETSIWKSDLMGEMREKIWSFSYEEGYVNNLLAWNNKLVWMMIPGPDYSSSQLYTFNALTQESEIFLEMSGLIDSPKIGGEILTWWSPSEQLGSCQDLTSGNLELLTLIFLYQTQYFKTLIIYEDNFLAVSRNIGGLNES